MPRRLTRFAYPTPANHAAVQDTVLTRENHRGPEIERWFGVEDGHDPAVENDWHLLPFMALSDGAHAYVVVERPQPFLITARTPINELT